MISRKLLRWLETGATQILQVHKFHVLTVLKRDLHLDFIADFHIFRHDDFSFYFHLIIVLLHFVDWHEILSVQPSPNHMIRLVVNIYFNAVIINNH